jgi:hypothetical protein
LSKKEHDDETVGQTNYKNIVCSFCKKILVPKGNAIKEAKYVIEIIKYNN